MATNTFNIGSTGQLNVAEGDATINASQINYNDSSAFDDINSRLTELIAIANSNQKEEIANQLPSIQNDVKEKKLTREKLTDHIKTLSSIISIANGIPALCDKIPGLIATISGLIH